MKTKILFVLALSLSLGAWAQKDEIKAATKAMKSGDCATAKNELQKAVSSVESADDKLKAQYYSLLGEAMACLAKKGDFAAYEQSFDAYNKLMEVEKQSGKEKYTEDAQTKLAEMKVDLVNAAIKSQNNNDNADAAKRLYMAYRMSPVDTLYLFYAAGSSVNSGNYDEALKYYLELKELGYDGSGVKYAAENVETGQTEDFPDMKTRDLYVKAGTHANPIDEKIPSKRSEIVKNIALIYQQQGKTDEALAAYEDAIAANPGDVNLILNKASLYYELGETEKFKSLMDEAITLAPDNPDLHYNVGVIAMEQKDYEGARAAYKKAVELKPDYVNAILNLSTTYVNEGNDLVDQMNELGSSRADMVKYDQLKEQRDSLFVEATKILEAAREYIPENTAVLNQLKNLYGALSDTENFKKMKELLGEE